jgi:Plasmid encoded RepA protein
LLESGHDRAGNPIGLPYGSYARFILLFLQSQAVKSQSREIELGRNMRVWLGAMGLSIGGTTYKLVNEQARRISSCRLTFFADRAGREVMRHGGFVDGSISLALSSTDAEEAQGCLWQERVLLDERFYQALLSHPVPVSEAGLRAIGAKSMVIDVYIWLAYRLHALKNDMPVSWPALHAQFGGGFGLVRKFRSHFIECLLLAMAAYPDASVSVEDAGLVLHPSRPAVAGL